MQTMLYRIDSYRYERWIVHCTSTGTLTLETNMIGKETVQPVSLGALPKQYNQATLSMLRDGILNGLIGIKLFQHERILSILRKSVLALLNDLHDKCTKL